MQENSQDSVPKMSAFLLCFIFLWFENQFLLYSRNQFIYILGMYFWHYDKSMINPIALQ